MSLNLQVLLKSWHWVVFITLGFMTCKGLIIFALGHLFRFPRQSTQNMTFILPQAGEFSFILFSSAVSTGIMDIESSSLFTASVIMSMAITPFIFAFNQRHLPIDEVSSSELKAVKNKIEKPDGKKEAEVIIAGFGRFGQTVSRVLKMEGIRHIILEHSASQVKAARKFNNEVYYGDASRVDILKSAGGDHAKIFVLAIDDMEKSIETAKMVRQNFPDIKIVARARHRRHAMNLLKLGIPIVHREIYFSGLEIARDVLLLKGKSDYLANYRLDKFRQYDEKILQKQMHLKDEEKFMSLTHQMNQDLIKLLEEDEKNQDEE